MTFLFETKWPSLEVLKLSTNNFTEAGVELLLKQEWANIRRIKLLRNKQIPEELKQKLREKYFPKTDILLMDKWSLCINTNHWPYKPVKITQQWSKFFLFALGDLPRFFPSGLTSLNISFHLSPNDRQSFRWKAQTHTPLIQYNRRRQLFFFKTYFPPCIR